MKIHTMPQRSEEWFAIRKSVIITASEMGVWLTKNDATSAKARLNHIAKKLAEPVYSDESLAGFDFLMELRAKESKAMDYNIPVQRGNALEPLARAEYERITGFQVAEVGFITSDCGNFGCSPDGLLVGDKDFPISDRDYYHGIEIKCPIPETHLKWLIAGTLPEDHKCQVHGSMAICGPGIDRWDFMSFCPGLPPLMLTIERDDFTAAISTGLETLRTEYIKLGMRLKEIYNVTAHTQKERVRRYDNTQD